MTSQLLIRLFPLLFQIGNIAANLISGYLLDYFDGWSSPFYFFGIAGVLWFICFVSLNDFRCLRFLFDFY